MSYNIGKLLLLRRNNNRLNMEVLYGTANAVPANIERNDLFRHGNAYFHIYIFFLYIFLR